MLTVNTRVQTKPGERILTVVRGTVQEIDNRRQKGNILVVLDNSFKVWFKDTELEVVEE